MTISSFGWTALGMDLDCPGLFSIFLTWSSPKWSTRQFSVGHWFIWLPNSDASVHWQSRCCHQHLSTSLLDPTVHWPLQATVWTAHVDLSTHHTFILSILFPSVAYSLPFYTPSSCIVRNLCKGGNGSPSSPAGGYRMILSTGILHVCVFSFLL